MAQETDALTIGNVTEEEVKRFSLQNSLVYVPFDMANQARTESNSLLFTNESGSELTLVTVSQLRKSLNNGSELTNKDVVNRIFNADVLAVQLFNDVVAKYRESLIKFERTNEGASPDRVRLLERGREKLHGYVRTHLVEELGKYTMTQTIGRTNQTMANYALSKIDNLLKTTPYVFDYDVSTITPYLLQSQAMNFFYQMPDMPETQELGNSVKSGTKEYLGSSDIKYYDNQIKRFIRNNEQNIFSSFDQKLNVRLGKGIHNLMIKLRKEIDREQDEQLNREGHYGAIEQALYKLFLRMDSRFNTEGAEWIRQEHSEDILEFLKDRMNNPAGRVDWGRFYGLVEIVYENRDYWNLADDYANYMYDKYPNEFKQGSNIKMELVVKRLSQGQLFNFMYANNYFEMKLSNANEEIIEEHIEDLKRE